MEIFLIFTGTFLIVLASIAIFNHSKAKSYLNQKLVVDKSTLNKVKNKVGITEASVVGVTLFDVLYNTAKMDPFVLKGVDHLHHSQNFESLADLSSFLKENIINSEEGTTAWRQMIHKYKGYTGEEYAFNKLDETGTNYIKPDSGTNEQYDAIIDGQKVDIAITDDPSYIAEKLKDPEVFVYTNKEMAAAYDGNPRVIIDENLSVQEMFQKTEDTFSGIEDLGDYIDGIPVITAIISGVRNTKGVLDGKKNIGTAIEHTATDVVGVGVGGWAGAEIGMSIGLALAPVTGGISAVVAPIIGSLGGVLGGRSISNWFKQRHLRKAKAELEDIVIEFRNQFLIKYDSIIHHITETFSENIKQSKFAEKNIQSWFGRIFTPKILAKFYSLASKRFKKELKDTKKYYNELKNKVESSTDYEGGMAIYSQGSNILAGNNRLLKIYHKLSNVIKKVESEIKKLS